jgi:AraC family transcriptional regulator, transcriptional activator of pobA
MKSPLPSYSIYGEHGRTLEIDWLHCESLAERSRLHDWEIRAHRHELLFQLFWIERGRCAVSFDGADQSVQGPCVLIVPPLVMHGFRFEPDTHGDVVTVLAQHVSKLLSTEPSLEKRLLRPRVEALTAQQAASVAGAVQALRDEFSRAEDWRALGVDSALIRLLVALGRNTPSLEDRASPQGARSAQHLQRFKRLIEARYRQQPALSALAGEIGITTTQLNRVCQALLGCSSVAVLHARLLLEAQRELAYTSMSIKQIAHGLGFSDAAYFTRFYQRMTGQSPTQWRKRSANATLAPTEAPQHSALRGDGAGGPAGGGADR